MMNKPNSTKTKKKAANLKRLNSNESNKEESKANSKNNSSNKKRK